MKPTRTLKLIYSMIALFSAEKIAAQITVHQEPHHKIIFENEYVRLIDLTLRPNDLTLEHTHSIASAVVFLTHSKVAIKDAGKPPVVTEFEPGNTVFRNYGEKPVLHTVWIEDTSVFRCLVAEMVHRELVPAGPVDQEDSIKKLLWRQKLADAYAIHLSSGQNYTLLKSGCAYLLICFSGKTGIEHAAKTQSLEAGEYAFFAPGQEVVLHAKGQQSTGCVLLKLN
jgi:hypothetical protein